MFHSYDNRLRVKTKKLCDKCLLMEAKASKIDYDSGSGVVEVIFTFSNLSLSLIKTVRHSPDISEL